MFNLFPDLLSYSLIAPFLLRVVVGFILFKFGWNTVTNKRPEVYNFTTSNKNTLILTKFLGLIHLILGLLFIIGLLTQVISLVVLLFSIISYTATKKKFFRYRDPVFFVLLGVICLSLVFSGAGAFALDLPL